MTKHWLLFDLETDNLLEDVTQVHCLTILDLNTTEMRTYTSALGDIEEGLARLSTADMITGHNIQLYDIPVIEKLYPGWTTTALVTDTLLTSRLIWSNLRRDDFVRAKKGEGNLPKHLIGRHSLEAWGYRLGEHKGDYSKMMKEKGLDPWAALNDEMVRYCEQDVRTNAKFWHIIKARKPSRRAVRLEHDIQKIITRQEANGVGFDERGAATLYGILSTRREILLAQCQELFPPWIVPAAKAHPIKSTMRRGLPMQGKTWMPPTGKQRVGREVFNVYEERTEGDLAQDFEIVTFNPASRDHVANRLTAIYGWIPTAFNSPQDEDDGGENGKPKITDEILKALPYPAAALLAEYYVVAKRLGMLAEGKQAWLKAVKDGCIYGKLNPQGTPTGRGTHSKPNLGQVPSITNADGKVPYGRECRALFRPTRKGWVQVGADAAGLELRCLGHRLFPFDRGVYGEVVLNGDVHWTNAQALGLVPAGTVRDKTNAAHEDARAVAKRFIYAFLYGGGPEMIGSIAGLTATELRALGTNPRIKQRLIRDGRHPDPAIIATIAKGEKLMAAFLKNLPALASLKEAISAELKANKSHLVGLDGRMLPSRSAHSALNLLLQSDGAIICKRWIVQFHEDMANAGYIIGKDWDQMLWVHDEIQIECRPEIAEAVAALAVAAVPKAGAYFDFNIALGGDAKIGQNWADCH